ncbi:MAG: hypothetical protein FJX74_10970, partial [Armatimonadetes bacterium]|nr:hypothetical protein [Armatimonadota bacterium]
MLCCRTPLRIALRAAGALLVVLPWWALSQTAPPAPPAEPPPPETGLVAPVTGAPSTGAPTAPGPTPPTAIAPPAQPAAPPEGEVEPPAEEAEEPTEEPEAIIPLFGHDVFAGAAERPLQPTLTPPPPTYVLGPGDEVELRVWGRGTEYVNLVQVISNDGALYGPTAGRLPVA